MTTPLQIYQQQVASGEIIADDQQLTALQYLQSIYLHLSTESAKNSNWLRQLKRRFATEEPQKGLYLWGGVGIGKTYVIDLFYDALQTTRKQRMHFHQFMQQVHHQLSRLQGEVDPLKRVAAEFASKADVLCLDEFLVDDITDAMLLAGLLQALQSCGVILITTANTAPEQLYATGLQRQKFLPAIALLKQHCDVIHMTTEADYRLAVLARDGVYFTPLDEHADKAMQHAFQMYAHHDEMDGGNIQIDGRAIATVSHAPHVVWFEFDVICNQPRSKRDYLEIAQRYHTVLVSNVTPIAAQKIDRATYFIHMIDIFYDQNIELLISASVPPEGIYPSGPMSGSFVRTLSRLQEMQSMEYLQGLHAADNRN